MKIFYILLFSILNFVSSTAQNNKKVTNNLDELVKEYNDLFSKTNLLVDSLAIYTKKEMDFPIWKNFLDYKATNEASFKNELFLDLKQKSFFSQGFVWVSDAVHNFRAGITENDDVYFKSRFSTGIDWLLLGDGSYAKNKKNTYLLANEWKKDSLEINEYHKESALKEKQEIIRYVFDIQRLKLLKSYEYLLQQKANYYNNMQKAELFNAANKLKIDNDLLKIKNLSLLIKNYLSENVDGKLVNTFGNLPYGFNDLPKLNEISFDRLLQDQSRINNLQKEILNSKNLNNDNISLRAKVRYNYYDSERQNARTFATVGASLYIPLTSNKNEDIVKYKMDTYDSRLNYKKNQLKEELIAKHQSFYILKNKLETKVNESLYLEAMLKNEIAVYNRKDKSFSPEKYIGFSIDLFELNLEILDIKEQLCEQFITFYFLIQDNNTTEESKKKQMVDTNKISSYLWKNFFQEHSNADILTLLQNNNITQLFLSPGENKEKTEDFIQQANVVNIEVLRLLGENSYAKTTDGDAKLIDKLNEIKEQNFNGIHLDIEPHTFEDYKTNKQFYIDNLNKLFAAAKKWTDTNNKKLSVSIPLNLPTDNAKLLAENNIEAYIMAYENTDQIKLLKRTESLRKILNNNFVWVLRLSDFENQKSVDNAIQDLNKNGIFKIGYYDVSMLKQD